MRLLIIIVIVFFASACKQEPTYHIKEPFGKITTSSVDAVEEEEDLMVIPKKFLNKDRLKERDRNHEVIKKKLKEAIKYDPSHR